MSQPPPRVSVIMRSKNSDWVIEDALTALFDQDFKDFELIVVDSGSTDRTCEIIRKFPSRLIEIEAQNYYPGAVLNSAIEQTRCELIVFQNSDSIPQSPDTLGNLIKAFDAPAVQAAFARQVPRPEAKTWVRREYAVSFPESGPAPSWIHMSLPLAAMRRSIWEQRPFYTDAWASEDSEWGHWAQNNGHTVLYVPEAVVRHSHNYTLRQLYGRRFVEGEADVFIYGGKAALLAMPWHILGSSLRDAAAYLSALDIVGLPLIPIRRTVYHWAYYKGHKHGERRIETGNKDASAGQQVVLTRHDE